MSGQPKGYDLLRSMILLSTSPLPVEAKLAQIIQSTSDAFPSGRCLFLKPNRIAIHGFFSRLASEKKPLWVENRSAIGKQGVLTEEEDLFCPSFASIPLFDETSFEGILYLGFPEPRKFSSEEMDLLVLIAMVMEEELRMARLRKQSEQKISELMALHEIGKAITSTLKLQDLLDLVVTTGLKTLKAKGGVLRLKDKRTGDLKVRFRLGEMDPIAFEERIAKRVFHSEAPLLLAHGDKEDPSLSGLSAPLFSKGGVMGTLTFYGKEADPSTFDEMDFQLLSTMANQISCAIENALIHYETSELVHEHEKRVQQLSTLWELNKTLLTTVNFERILQMVLTAITIGGGLGFNRAMLFLVNEKTQTLEGTMAVGPDSAEEAGRIWATLSQKQGTLSDLVTQFSLGNHAVLNETVKAMQLPLSREECILSKTVLEGRPFNIQLHPSDGEILNTPCGRGCDLGVEVGCYVGQQLSDNPKVYSFASVPLWGKGKVIGVILVDNLYNQNPIKDDDIQFLSMFSNLAGLAIENTRLYRNLEEVHEELKDTQTRLVHREKMAALGELSTTITHEIRNPLVSIGGFARRLYLAVPHDSPETRYAQAIMKEVGRLESILNDIQNYTRDEALVPKELDLREVLKESLTMASTEMHAEKIQFVKEFADELPRVKGDHSQLKQAFFNLIANSCQAMKGKGALLVRIRPVSKGSSPFVKVEVEDKGKGIDPENLHHIFNPFYTTKEGSLGLGLPIVHKVVTSHGGQIEVDNHPGKGVTFIITLPALQEKEGK